MAEETCVASLADGAPTALLASILSVITTILAIPTLVYVIGYLIPQIYMCVRAVPDLKSRYSADLPW